MAPSTFLGLVGIGAIAYKLLHVSITGAVEAGLKAEAVAEPKPRSFESARAAYLLLSLIGVVAAIVMATLYGHTFPDAPHIDTILDDVMQGRTQGEFSAAGSFDWVRWLQATAFWLATMLLQLTPAYTAIYYRSRDTAFIMILTFVNTLLVGNLIIAIVLCYYASGKTDSFLRNR